MSSQVELTYGEGQKAGVALIAFSALLSLVAIVSLVIFKRPKRETFQNVHMFGYFVSLLFANVLQSIGSIIDLEWVAKGRVVSGSLCSVQGASKLTYPGMWAVDVNRSIGGIKQVGNLGASISSLIIALHLFHILFLRIRATKPVFVGAIITSWSLILLLILIGRFGFQRANRGPYFDIAGSSCGIAPEYVTERIVLDYLFVFLSIGLGLILYTLVLFRVRGTLIRDKYHHWRFNFGGNRNDWSRTIIQDNSMNEIARKLVWYPVSYSAILIPITVVRVVQIDGKAVPFWIVAIAGFIYNLMGFINVILLVYIQRHTPQPSLPMFAESRVNSPYSFDSSGNTPHSFESRGNSPYPYEKSRDIVEIDIKAEDGAKSPQRNSQSRKVLVKLPKQPPNTFVAPDSWKTTAPRGKQY